MDSEDENEHEMSFEKHEESQAKENEAEDETREKDDEENEEEEEERVDTMGQMEKMENWNGFLLDGVTERTRGDEVVVDWKPGDPVTPQYVLTLAGYTQ
ncbi:protein unc-119 homolog B, partial [Tachysurus ichikawai]